MGFAPLVSTVALSLRNLSLGQLWLAYYVMLSRARRIDDILSLGLPKRSVLEGGPPSTLMNTLSKLFDERKKDTLEAMRLAKEFLDW